LVLVDLAGAGLNPRMEAYKVFDPDLELVRDWLNAEHPVDASAFEKGVARLFTLLGFCVDALSGDRRMGDAVDLIGYAESASVVMAVECTTGSIDAGGKLGKLVSRTRRIRSALPSHEVMPVLVTALPKELISEAELRSAAEDALVVVTRDDALELFEMLAESPTVLRVLDFLRSRMASRSHLPFAHGAC